MVKSKSSTSNRILGYIIALFLLVALSSIVTGTQAHAASTSSVYSYLGVAPTAAEKKLMKAHPIQAAKIYNLSQTAVSLTKEYYGNSGHNDNSDAFRHCLWSALITREYGASTAKTWTDAHESTTPTTQSEKLENQMDLYNNSVGRSLSVSGKSNADIAKSVKTKVKNGKLKRLNAKGTGIIATDGTGLKK